MNYLGEVSVDTASHVITHIQAFEAHQRDSQCLPAIIEGLTETLNQNGIGVEEIVADTGFSSGEALKALEQHNIKGYIPNKGQFVYERPGFVYDSKENSYRCPNNQTLVYKGTFEMSPGAYNNIYRANRKECNKCPLHSTCSAYGKRDSLISETVDKPYYQKMHIRMQTRKARILMKKRQSTVEPVIGTLINYLGMKKVNTKGLAQANKCMTLSAVAYNLKKLLSHKTIMSQIKAAELIKYTEVAITGLLNLISDPKVHLNQKTLRSALYLKSC